MFAAHWSVTSWHRKVIKTSHPIPFWSLWLYNLMYLLVKMSILKTRMVLQLLIVRPSIYFVNKFCLFFLDPLIIINTSMLSCASNVISQWRWIWQPFFEDPKFVNKLSMPRPWLPFLLLNFPLRLPIAMLDIMIFGFSIS